MIKFKAIINRFKDKGEKSNWFYIDIPAQIASEIKKDTKVSFRVKGFLDHVTVEGLSLTPMGEGDFIIALKADLRKKLGKGMGATIHVQLEEHKNFKIEMPEDLELCLLDELDLMERFKAQPMSHQNYFFNWINAAKTEATRTKRVAMTVNAMANKMNYGEMIRAEKKKKE